MGDSSRNRDIGLRVVGSWKGGECRTYLAGKLEEFGRDGATQGLKQPKWN